MRLYGEQWSRRELEARVGRIEQLGGIRRMRLEDGPERGVEVIEADTGAGLSFGITPDKGMDLAYARYRGVPLHWLSSNGLAHPHGYDASGTEWLRTASGGLLMTCGLTQMGSPSEDGGKHYGLHGRIHHTQARQVGAWGEWTDDDRYVMTIRGVLEETSIFGDKLRLTRTVTAELGGGAIRLEDVVENVGFRPAEHLVLYHFNFGFPLLREDSTVEFPSCATPPMDRLALAPLSAAEAGAAARWEQPQPGMEERVYYRELRPDADGEASVVLRSPSFPAGAQRGVWVELRWNAAALPKLVQWRMPGAGEHVLGIEPANGFVDGRAAERTRSGTLPTLAPGQHITYKLELRVGDLHEYNEA